MALNGLLARTKALGSHRWALGSHKVKAVLDEMHITDEARDNSVLSRPVGL